MSGLKVALLGGLIAVAPIEAQLTVTMVGNAGVVLSDGHTSLLVDLPYESGAFGYMAYDAGALAPPGQVVAVITHDHRDHFAPTHLIPRVDWRVFGPASVTQAIPEARVLLGDSIRVGDFSVVVVPTPHTNDHRSYRVRWRGWILHFSGDTEDPASLRTTPQLDLLFVSPWLSCAAEDTAGFQGAGRRIAYHLAPDGSDVVCGSVDVLRQGASFELGR